MEHSTDELVATFFRTKAAAYASPTTVKAWIDSGNQDFVLVDVRLRGAARTWQIPGSLEIPATQIGERLNELPKDKMNRSVLLGYLVQPCHDGCGRSCGSRLSRQGAVRWRSSMASSTLACEERIREATVPPSPTCAC